jgi:hypothetical protein
MPKKMLWIGICAGIVIGLLLATSGIALAGQLSPGVGPDGAGSQMFTLEQIYQRLSSGAAGTKMTAFSEPASGPGTGTMHTLDEIMASAPALDASNGATMTDVASGKTFWGLTAGQWGLQTGSVVTSAYPAPVPKTGQTTSYGPADDGALRKGVAWPNPRFTDNLNGTVTDNLTGLIWLKNANCNGMSSFLTSREFAINLANGVCGLSDGSIAGAWRMPNVREMLSLVDYEESFPVLPAGHPFTAVSGIYWTSTGKFPTLQFYIVDLADARSDTTTPNAFYFVWPVRGGQ